MRWCDAPVGFDDPAVSVLADRIAAAAHLPIEDTFVTLGWDGAGPARAYRCPWNQARALSAHVEQARVVGVGVFISCEDAAVVAQRRADWVLHPGVITTVGESVNMGDVRGDAVVLHAAAARGVEEELGVRVDPVRMGLVAVQVKPDAVVAWFAVHVPMVFAQIREHHAVASHGDEGEPVAFAEAPGAAVLGARIDPWVVRKGLRACRLAAEQAPAA